jgi:myosin-5
MKIQRPKYLAALKDKKLQADMAYQLQKLQERLHQEQTRNQALLEERDSSTREGLMHEQGVTEKKSSWMADADGIISKLQDEVNRLRKENQEQKSANATLKNEFDKLRSEKEVIAANYHVKIRQYEDLVSEALCLTVQMSFFPNPNKRCIRFVKRTRSWK